MTEIERAKTWCDAMDARESKLTEEEVEVMEDLDGKPESFQYTTRRDLIIAEKRDLILRGGDEDE